MTIIVSRHGESVASANEILSGDPARDEGLTPRGERQAAELGRQLAGDSIERRITSVFPRTRETGEIALTGRDVPFAEMASLDDLRYGEIEGRPRAAYKEWAREHGMTDRLPGGESKADVARRLCEAFDEILRRDEACILVVTHELLISYLLLGMEGEEPHPGHPDVPYATPYRFANDDVARAIAVIRSWLDTLHHARSR